MAEVNSSLSRRELKSFLEELAEQVESGKIIIHVPGTSPGKIKILPEQPIDLTLDHDGEEGELSIKMYFEEKR